MADKGVSMNGQPTGGVSMNGESIPVAQGTPIQPVYVQPGAPVPAAYAMHDQMKVGSKCCGCCCDFRRAVIILDIILIILAGIGLIGLALPDSVNEQRYQQMGIDDDAVQDVVLEMATITQIISGCGVLMLCVPVYGAMNYNKGMVAFGAVWFLATFVAQIVVEVIYIGKANDAATDQNFGQPFINWIFAAIITGFFIYPHAGLVNEINSGIMSKETYPREEYSCCCGPN